MTADRSHHRTQRAGMGRAAVRHCALCQSKPPSLPLRVALAQAQRARAFFKAAARARCRCRCGRRVGEVVFVRLISTNLAQRPIGPLTRALIGGTQPLS